MPTHIANVATINGDSFKLYAPPEITDLIRNRLPEYPGMKLIYALGGRSLIWGAVSPRMPAFEIASWPVSFDEMELYYNADDIPIAADLDQTRFGKLHSNVFFSSILLLARALTFRPFDLAVNTYATEVVTEGGKAVGVRVKHLTKNLISSGRKQSFYRQAHYKPHVYCLIRGFQVERSGDISLTIRT